MQKIINGLLLLNMIGVLDLAHHDVIAILEHLYGASKVLSANRLTLFTSLNDCLQFLNFFLILFQ